MIKKTLENIHLDIEEHNKKFKDMSPTEIILWGYKTFDKLCYYNKLWIQSSVILHMVQKCSLQKKIKIFWIDTGYLPPETYQYAEKLINELSLEIEVLQSELTPARMESLYGKLWETDKSNDLDKYHEIRKVKPLENALNRHQISCWASGVRSEQTDNRNKMKFVDVIRERLSLRPLLKWKSKDVFITWKKINYLLTHFS